MKTTNIIYWISTGIVSAVMLFSIINFTFFDHVQYPEGAFVHLGILQGGTYHCKDPWAPGPVATRNPPATQGIRVLRLRANLALGLRSPLFERRQYLAYPGSFFLFLRFSSFLYILGKEKEAGVKDWG